MARNATDPEEFHRPLRRVLIGLLVLALIGLFTLWRIDSPRVERFRAALIDRFVPSMQWPLSIGNLPRTSATRSGRRCITSSARLSRRRSSAFPSPAARTIALGRNRMPGASGP